MQKISQTCSNYYGQVHEYLEPSFKKHENNLLLKTMRPNQFCAWIEMPLEIIFLKIDYSQYQKNYQKSNYLKPGKIHHLSLALYEIAFKATLVSLVAGVIAPIQEHLFSYFSECKGPMFLINMIPITIFLGLLTFHPLVLVGLMSPVTAALTLNTLLISAGHITQGIGHLISLFDDPLGLNWINRGNLLIIDFLRKAKGRYASKELFVKIFLENRSSTTFEQLKIHLVNGRFADHTSDGLYNVYRSTTNKFLLKACEEILKNNDPQNQLANMSELASSYKVINDNVRRESFFSSINFILEEEISKNKKKNEISIKNLQLRVKAHQVVVSDIRLRFWKKVFLKNLLNCEGDKCPFRNTVCYHSHLSDELEKEISELSNKHMVGEEFLRHVKVASFYDLSLLEQFSYLKLLDKISKSNKENSKLAEKNYKELILYFLNSKIKLQKNSILTPLMVFNRIKQESKLSIPKPVIKMILVELIKAKLYLKEENKPLIHNALFV